MNGRRVKFLLLPGGKMPRRATPGAVGFDVYLRAIVSPTEMDPSSPNLRRAMFDFRTFPSDPTTASHVRRFRRRLRNQLVYRLGPGESVLAGIGFIAKMPPSLFYQVAPRSGLITKSGIVVANAWSVVDPDYRGEAGVLVRNTGPECFELRAGLRIAQIIFQEAVIP